MLAVTAHSCCMQFLLAVVACNTIGLELKNYDLNEIKNLKIFAKKFIDKKHNKNINLDIKKGEVTAILGKPE